MLTMNLEGLEMIAVLVVVVLFVKVLERFGLLAAGYDGKRRLEGLFSGEKSHLLLKFKPPGGRADRVCSANLRHRQLFVGFCVVHMLR